MKPSVSERVVSRDPCVDSAGPTRIISVRRAEYVVLLLPALPERGVKLAFERHAQRAQRHSIKPVKHFCHPPQLIASQLKLPKHSLDYGLNSPQEPRVPQQPQRRSPMQGISHCSCSSAAKPREDRSGCHKVRAEETEENVGGYPHRVNLL